MLIAFIYILNCIHIREIYGDGIRYKQTSKSAFFVAFILIFYCILPEKLMEMALGTQSLFLGHPTMPEEAIKAEAMVLLFLVLYCRSIHQCSSSSLGALHRHIVLGVGRGDTCCHPVQHEEPSLLRGRRQVQWNQQAVKDPLDGLYPVSSQCRCPLLLPRLCRVQKMLRWSWASESGLQWIQGNPESI